MKFMPQYKSNPQLKKTAVPTENLKADPNVVLVNPKLARNKKPEAAYWRNRLKEEDAAAAATGESGRDKESKTSL